LIVYEYPFNEGIRTMLRLERLFTRLAQLVPRDTPTDHHYALATLFEIMDVISRSDFKAELLQELALRHETFESYRGIPSISEGALNLAIDRIVGAHRRLGAIPGRPEQSLAANEWLMSVRSRINIPGGTCEFDLPGYFAWQHESANRRRHDLLRWVGVLDPLAEALEVNLGLLRESGQTQMAQFRGGLYQQNLAGTRGYQLARVEVDPSSHLIPEISGNRVLLAVRLTRADNEGRLRPMTDSLQLPLTLCA
jgi:cell division protein ZapD